MTNWSLLGRGNLFLPSRGSVGVDLLSQAMIDAQIERFGKDQGGGGLQQNDTMKSGAGQSDFRLASSSDFWRNSHPTKYPRAAI